MTVKYLRKVIQQLVLMCYMLKKEIFVLPTFQKTTEIAKKVILLMIPNEEGWHSLEVKKLPALLRGITSKHDSNFYYLNCLYSFRSRSKLESQTKARENRDFCGVVRPSEKNKILDFNNLINS